MSENFQKLTLGANHRRVVSSVLRHVEATGDEVLAWIRRPGGILQHLSEDISDRQADELRALVGRLREEINRVQNEVAADPSSQSRSRRIAALVSLARIELQEVLTPGLRGYGSLLPETEAALDAKFGRLLACLEAMSRVVEHSGPRSAP